MIINDIIKTITPLVQIRKHIRFLYVPHPHFIKLTINKKRA